MRINKMALPKFIKQSNGFSYLEVYITLLLLTTISLTLLQQQYMIMRVQRLTYQQYIDFLQTYNAKEIESM